MNFENLVDLTMTIFAKRDHKTQSVNYQLNDRGRLGTEVASDFKKFHFKNRQYVCMIQKANKQQKVMLLISAPSAQCPRHHPLPNQATIFISVFMQM